MTSRTTPVRVLHIVGRLHVGGIEKWLLEVCRRVDRSSVTMDFVVQSKAAGAYDDEIRSLGSGIFVVPRPARPWAYPRYLAQLATILSQGSYDVVHAHMGPNSAVILSIAKLCHVPVRVAHSHSEKYNPRGYSFPKNLYLALSKRALGHAATHKIGVSTRAAHSLFGAGWVESKTAGILSCGIDLAPIHTGTPQRARRAELGIEAGAPVIGTAGRIAQAKNPELLAEIFAAVLGRIPDAWFVVIGDGPERERFEQKATTLGIRERLVITGFREDVVPLIRDTLDVFVVPSRVEGLSLVTIEAQATGVPVVVSDAIPEEANVVQQLFTRMPAGASSTEWAETIVPLLRDRIPADEALQAVAESPFNIDHSVEALQHLYLRGTLAHHHNHVATTNDHGID